MKPPAPDADLARERELQESFVWARSGTFDAYNAVLAYYQAQAVLEHARGATLLDMPCGDGLLTEHLAGRFDEVVGVDASETHLAQARTRLPDAELHHALIEDVNLGRTFGTVTMLNVLEHVLDPIAVLRTAAELVDDDGVIIVHVPNSQAVNRKIAVLMGTLETCDELSPYDVEVAGHRRSYDLGSLRSDIEASGLTATAMGGVFYKMLSTPQMDWLLRAEPWAEGGFGWGRVGAPPRDWKSEFCRACYEYGREHPEDSNVIYACAVRA